MSKNFLEALKRRRTYYAIKNESPISDMQIEEIINTAVKYVPSAFNSQSARVVLLLGEKHLRMWDIVKEVLHERIGDEAFKSTEQKIDSAFRSGYGTVLFYEDLDDVKALQEQFPLYAENFPTFSVTSNGMLQLSVWTALEEEGFGASLQHYNPLIDERLAKEFDIPASWDLKAQMPFGMPAAQPDEKTFKPLEDRIKIFR
ncbi:MAG: nitroreductase family protein [Prevotella sp.]|nr:nitroreductase family protein [Prevotella sp.]